METKQSAPQKTRRWIKVVFVLSLGLNVLIVGLVAGAFIKGGAPDHIRVERNISALGLRVYFRALNQGDRTQIRANIKQNREQIKAGHGVFRAHLTALANALTAEPYDPATVASILSQQGDAVSNNFLLGQKVLLEQIATMTKVERQDFAAALKKPAKRRRR